MRGPATPLRCDRGSNFVGGKLKLDEALAEMDKKSVERYLSEQGCEWQFNPPHATPFWGGQGTYHSHTDEPLPLTPSTLLM